MGPSGTGFPAVFSLKIPCYFLSYVLILPDFRRFSQNIVLRSPGEYSSEKDC